MLNLFKNEYAKIFLKKSTYIVLGVCLLVSIGISLLIQFDYDDMYDDYFFGDISLEEEMAYAENSEDIYDKLYHKSYEVFIDMGYEFYHEIPEWIIDAVNDTVYDHFKYIFVSESSDVEQAEFDAEISLEGVDIAYEKKIAEEKLNAIKAKNYKAYSTLWIEYVDKNKDYMDSREKQSYEYHKYIIEHDINPETEKEKIWTIQNYTSAKAQYEELLEKQKQGESVSQYSLEQKKEVYEVYKYIVENNLDKYLTKEYEVQWQVKTDNFITALMSNTMTAGMTGIFVMIIAAGIIANEFSNGTIKFLLINPIKRAKIFWSKYITCISLLAASLVVFYIVHFLFCLIICGADGASGVYLYYENGAVSEQSIILYSLKQYLLSGVSLLTSVTLAFTISSLMRNNAIAIAISIAIEFLGATITLFLYEFGHDWARYLVFANTDLASISKGEAIFPGQTLSFSFIVIAVYMVIYLFTAYDAFKKKEV